MEWVKIIGTIVASSSAVYLIVKLVLNKLIVKIDGVSKQFETQAIQLGIIGAKVDATVTANEKENGNGYSGYYKEALDQNLKILELEKGS